MKHDRCKSVTRWYVPTGSGGNEVKAIIRCTLEKHDFDEQMCSATVADSRPQATVLWRGQADVAP